MSLDVGFQNHIPARGRKPGSAICNCRENTTFQNHIPSRGRKLHKPRRSFELFRFQNHIPARGRKLLRIRFARAFLIVNFKTTSPQGDGNSSLILSIISHLVIFQNHIPARGRKLERKKDFVDLFLRISKPHPRKGTET